MQLETFRFTDAEFKYFSHPGFWPQKKVTIFTSTSLKQNPIA
jgi:hypothetical protein